MLRKSQQHSRVASKADASELPADATAELPTDDVTLPRHANLPALSAVVSSEQLAAAAVLATAFGTNVAAVAQGQEAEPARCRNAAASAASAGVAIATGQAARSAGVIAAATAAGEADAAAIAIVAKTVKAGAAPEA